MTPDLIRLLLAEYASAAVAAEYACSSKEAEGYEEDMRALEERIVAAFVKS